MPKGSDTKVRIYSKPGRPKLGIKYHWLLWYIREHLGSHYNISYKKEVESYYLEYTGGKKRIDRYIIVRSKPKSRVYRVTYMDTPTLEMTIKSFNRPTDLADYLRDNIARKLAREQEYLKEND